MIDNKYIVKSLTPWMMDELISFSELSKFDLILLRKPDNFYTEQIQVLKDNGINILVKPNSFTFFFRKLLIVLKFLANNTSKFVFNYNLVIGIKSIYWFLRIDLKQFSENTNIHAQFATQSAVLSLLIKRYYSNKPSISFTFHAYDIYFKNKWFKLLIDNCHKAFSISDYNIKYVKEKFTNSDKIVLSRLGVFRDNILKVKKKEVEYFTMGLMSWFVEKKGINYLLEAIKILKKNGFEEIRLKLAGNGPLKGNILSFINKNNITNMVEYVGIIEGKEKDEFYNSLDIFVLPSIQLKNDQDGIPVVLMEAIAYGLPLISTEVSGIPEICIDEYNGKLIQERNVQHIYDSILELMNNEEQRIDYSTNSKILSKEYDIELNSKEKLKELNWI